METRQRRYVTKAYLTFVGVDHHGRPRPVPALELDTDDDRRRHAAADARRLDRLRAAGRMP
jgi:acyl-CoA hydrolase